MTRKVLLTKMQVKETGKVAELQGGQGMIRNLENMGIRIGVTITKVAQHFMRGPVVVQQARTTVAIGYGMAHRIMVDVADRPQGDAQA